MRLKSEREIYFPLSHNEETGICVPGTILLVILVPDEKASYDGVDGGGLGDTVVVVAASVR